MNEITAGAIPVHPVKQRQVGSFMVDTITHAPLQIEMSLRLNISQEKAFQLVFRDLDTWFKQIDKIEWKNAESQGGANTPGLNSVRVCGFDGNQLYEDIVYYDAPRAYGYVIDLNKSTASFPVKNPLGMFLVQATGENESILTWRQYFNRKFHPAALLIKFMVKNILMKKNLRRLIDTHGGEFL